MTCPTCDDTMYKINDAYPWTFWCPRCGTLKCELLGNCKVHTPQLIHSCRLFLVQGLPANLAALWQQLGINEAVYTAKERRIL